MSEDARIRGLVDDAVRRATEPLHAAVDALSARLAAVEGSGEPAAPAAQKRSATGRAGRRAATAAGPVPGGDGETTAGG